jgi:hypothetical protein
MAMPKQKKKLSAMSHANKAMAMATALKNSREKKFLVTSFVQSCDKLGHLYSLNVPQQGLSDTERVGDRIWVDRMSFDLWRVLPGSASGRFSVRFLIILDRQNTITNLDQIFLGVDGSSSPLLQFVKDFRKQFVVLYDSGSNHMDQYNKGETTRSDRKLNIRTQFVSGTTTIATGSLKLVCFSNIADTVSQKPLLIGSVRVDYTDA